ncbi:GAF domain-containing protein [Arthrobacter alkaliphilus]|uniref:GAF domain-containing protein n=1 Tax=Arthrobacter alkaliphilus TaxID=369936 RepID=UPI001F462F54|nr:GAF domain-containing protein [Arthrobacter alkaliphilus]
MTLNDVQEAVDRQVGFLLFTVLGFIDDGQTMIRLHSSNPPVYPVGGRKNMSVDVSQEWATLFDGGKVPYFGRTKHDVQRVFADHDLINNLGCGAIINAPVLDGGNLIGALNILNAEGIYSEASLVAAQAIAVQSCHAVRAELERMK